MALEGTWVSKTPRKETRVTKPPDGNGLPVPTQDRHINWVNKTTSLHGPRRKLGNKPSTGNAIHQRQLKESSPAWSIKRQPVNSSVRCKGEWVRNVWYQREPGRSKIPSEGKPSKTHPQQEPG